MSIPRGQHSAASRFCRVLALLWAPLAAQPECSDARHAGGLCAASDGQLDESVNFLQQTLHTGKRLGLKGAAFDPLGGKHEIAGYASGDLDANASVPDMELEDLPFHVDLEGLKMVEQAQRELRLLKGHRKRRITLWLHIHKSAGTFMCNLAGVAGEQIVTPSLNCNWNPHDIYGASGSPAGNGVSCQQRLAYFRDHDFSWGQIERELFPNDLCWDEFDYGVMLREPLALMRSMMNFHPTIGKGFVTALRSEIDSPSAVVDPSQNPIWKMMDNFAVRVLAPAMDVPAGRIGSSHLEAARETLRRFRVVQRLEDVPDTAGAFFERLGWPASMRVHIHRKVNAAAKKYDFTQDEEAWLKEVNRHDLSLYESYR